MDVALLLDMNMNMPMSINGLILISTKDPLWYGYFNIYYKLVLKPKNYRCILVTATYHKASQPSMGHNFVMDVGILCDGYVNLIGTDFGEISF